MKRFTRVLVQGAAVGLVLAFALFGVRILILRMTGKDGGASASLSSVLPLPSSALYQSTPEHDRTLNRFIASVLQFAILHEIGHMVIESYPQDAPTLGSEEDMADRFAGFYLTLHNDERDPVLRKKLNGESARVMLSATTFWGGCDRYLRGNRHEPLQFQDAHLLNPQRAELLGCLLYGSNPGDFGFVADQLKMSRERRQNCVGQTADNRTAWSQVVRNHLSIDLSGRLSSGSLAALPATVELDDEPVGAVAPESARRSAERGRQILEANKTLEFAVGVLRQFRSPRPAQAHPTGIERTTDADLNRIRSGRPLGEYDYHVMSDACVKQEGFSPTWSQAYQTLSICYGFVTFVEDMGKSLLVEESAQQLLR